MPPALQWPFSAAHRGDYESNSTSRCRFRSDFRSSFACFPFHCFACRHRSCPALLPDDVSGSGYCYCVPMCFFQYRYGKFGSGKTHLLPHDCTLYSCIAAHDSGYVCLQNSILAHHVHAEPESARITGKVSDRLIHEHNRYL